MPLLVAALLVPLLAPPAHAHEPPAGEVTSLGTPMVFPSARAGGAVGPGADGRPLLYSVSARDNNLGLFNVVDATTGELRHRYELGRGTDSYGVAVAPDNSVYVATNVTGRLFRWKQGATGLEDLGRLAASESHLYKLAFDEAGNVYTGTYPGGRVLRYDVATGQVRDYGQVAPGQTYVRSVGYHKGTIYAGTQPHAHLVAVDAASGARREIALPEGTDLDQVLYDINVVGDLLFARVSKTGLVGTLMVYDLTTGTWGDRFPGVSGLDVTQVGEDGKVYFSKDGELTGYDVRTRRLTPTGLKLPEFFPQLRGVGFGTLDDPAYPGQTVIGGLNTGQMFWYNPGTGQSKIVETGIEPNPIRMRSIGVAPDGRVVTGGTGTGAVAFVDPGTGESRSHRISELMGVASFRGKVYLGAYPRARIYEYDPSREWRLGVNPKEVWNGDAVLGDRPFAMIPVGDRLAIGTVNKSGYLGGQLLFHDPRTGRTEVHDGLVKDQSIMSLAYRNGILYAGTSVYGGYGAAETETDAKLVAWDVRRGRKLWEKTPVPGERTVSSLTFDRYGRLWGATAGVVFRYERGGFTSRRFAAFNWPHDGGYALADLAFRKRDGRLYGSMPGVGLYRLDPRTWRMTVITERPVYRMTLHPDGRVFANDGAELLRHTPGRRRH